MNLKKILFICLILMILSITAVSAADSDNINATDSIEPAHEIEPVKTVDHDSNLEPVSKNKPVDLSKIQTTSTSPGTFDDLQLEINNAEGGSVLVLTRDYTGHYGSRIHLDKDITIDGQGHTLDCLGQGGCSAFYSTAGNIVLKNIRIVGGHNDYNGQGGALHIEGFAKYTLENCEFAVNWAEEYGGAIYNDGEALIIKNCTFDANTADDESGGAIYSTKDVIIDDSTFTNNHAKESGGAIYSEGTVTVDAKQATAPYCSIFDYNRAHADDGGAIYAGSVNIKNAQFKQNIAFNYGGAVYAMYDITATNCVFESNYVSYRDGGAIYIQTKKDKDSYINNCDFKDNSAWDYGGAIYMNEGALYINGGNFEKNYAEDHGGAIYANCVYINADQSGTEAINTYFTGNTAKNAGLDSHNGGAIYTKNGGRITNVYFKDNTAKEKGGAIYSDENGNLDINHCIFENNHATGKQNECYGGAICSDSDVYIHNSTFKNNYADDYGGAIYAKNVRINHDREGETADTFFIDNKAKDNDGGAIYAKDDVFARNVAFINNAAYVDGGAIYAGKNVEVIRSIFESNQANGASVARCYGGAIRAGENARINDCTFKNNHADNRGGAVYASTVTLEGDKNTFEGNSAKDYGGAIYTDTFTGPVSHVSFINNKVEGDGGAVYINNENWITFIDCIFMDNRAANKGGAIYLDSKNSHMTIVSNVFINNFAGKEGHTVFNSGYYDAISGNFWSMIPTEYDNQLVEWKATTSNVQHIDYYPVTFTIEILGLCCANATSGVKICFVGPDGTSATLPMIAEYFSMSGIEGIEIGDKEVSSDGITIWFTPTEVGTYELPAYIAGMTGIITINVIDGGEIIPEPIIPDIPKPITPDIPKPVIPTAKTNC